MKLIRTVRLAARNNNREKLYLSSFTIQSEGNCTIAYNLSGAVTTMTSWNYISDKELIAHCAV